MFQCRKPPRWYTSGWQSWHLLRWPATAGLQTICPSFCGERVNMSSLLETIQSPADLKRLNPAEMVDLAEEIRAFLIHTLSKTGGHLGPNLGVVELTLALHSVFDTPTDKFVFDVSHH